MEDPAMAEANEPAIDPDRARFLKAWREAQENAQEYRRRARISNDDWFRHNPIC